MGALEGEDSDLIEFQFHRIRQICTDLTENTITFTCMRVGVGLEETQTETVSLRVATTKVLQETAAYMMQLPALHAFVTAAGGTVGRGGEIKKHPVLRGRNARMATHAKAQPPQLEKVSVGIVALPGDKKGDNIDEDDQRMHVDHDEQEDQDKSGDAGRQRERAKEPAKQGLNRLVAASPAPAPAPASTRATQRKPAPPLRPAPVTTTFARRSAKREASVMSDDESGCRFANDYPSASSVSSSDAPDDEEYVPTPMSQKPQKPQKLQKSKKPQRVPQSSVRKLRAEGGVTKKQKVASQGGRKGTRLVSVGEADLAHAASPAKTPVEA